MNLPKYLEVSLHFAIFVITNLSACPSWSANSYADKAFINAQVYTSNPRQPWAQAVAVQGENIVYVGDENGIGNWIGTKTQVKDLGGKLMLPGLVDSHAHPGLIAWFPDVPPMPFTETRPVPYTSKNEVLFWLRQYAKDNPDLPIIVSIAWRAEEFGANGPHKKDLDAIIDDRPVILFSNYGHSSWVNSKALEILGVAKESEPSTGPSYFERDETGDPTGFVKEFAALPLLEIMQKTDSRQFDFIVKLYLNYLASAGVTTIFDAGNLHVADRTYRTISRIEKDGDLPVRIEGSYHVYSPGQLDNAVAELKRLRDNYGGEKLKFNTIKIHFDGVHWQVNTAAMLEPYHHDPEEMGRTLVGEERLKDFILELHRENINLHMHVWGDRATRIALDVYQSALEQVGKELNTRMTLCHLIFVDDEDTKRFRELDVVANFTFHWFDFGRTHMDFDSLGSRAASISPAKTLINLGATVTFGSDELSLLRIENSNPLVNIQAGHNRQGVPGGDTAMLAEPLSERLSLEEMIEGYTINGAYQLRMDDLTGSIAVGKKADLVVFADDIFGMNRYDLHDAEVHMTILEGQTTFEDSLWEKAKSIMLDIGLWYLSWSNS